MAHTIFIPTDFSIESTQVLVKYLAEAPANTQVNVLFGAGYYTSESILDMLFYSKSKVYKDLKLEAFAEAIEIIENKYSDIIGSIKVELFTGWNQTAFQNFLEGNSVDQIIFSKDLKLKSQHKKWFDIVPYINKLNYKLEHVAVPKEESSFQQVALSPLFFQ